MAPSKHQVSRAAFCRSGPTPTTSRGQLCHRTTRVHEAPSKDQGVWTQRTNFLDISGQDLPQHLKELLPEPETLLDGRVVAWGFIGRGECIYTYFRADGTMTRLYRPGAVVFEESSLYTLLGSPLTNLHPPEEEGWEVTSESWQQHTHGVALTPGRAYPEHGLVAGKFVISTREALEAWRGGRRFLSTGEKSLEVEVPGGVVDGQPYDRMVLEVGYNHVALVDNPAAGPRAQLRAHQLPYNVRTNTQETLMEWTTIIVAGVELRVPKDQEDVYRARANSLAEQVPPETEAALEQAQTENAQLRAQNDELTAQNTELRANDVSAPDEAVITQRVNEATQGYRSALLKVWPIIGAASKVEGGKLQLTRTNSAGEAQQVDLSEANVETLYREAILTKRPNARVEGESVDYLRARLDSLLEHHTVSTEATQILDNATANARVNNTSAADPASAKAKRDAALAKRKARLEGRGA